MSRHTDLFAFLYVICWLVCRSGLCLCPCSILLPPSSLRLPLSLPSFAEDDEGSGVLPTPKPKAAAAPKAAAPAAAAAAPAKKAADNKRTGQNGPRGGANANRAPRAQDQDASVGEKSKYNNLIFKGHHCKGLCR